MKKEAQVHMLPTDIKGGQGHTLWTNADGQLLHTKTSGNDLQGQHLYFTTDEEIKEGDWFIHPDATVPQNDFNHVYVDCRKIIATTDPKLLKPQIKQVNWIGSERIMSLPQIPQSFIEEYCKAGGIDKVLVEWENRVSTDDVPPYYINRPKVDSNNCIIAHPVEEKMYSREEIIIKLDNLLLQDVLKLDSTQTETLDKWIKKNL